MPNIVENILVVRGNLTAFYEQYVSEPFRFENIAPTPEILMRVFVGRYGMDNRVRVHDCKDNTDVPISAYRIATDAEIREIEHTGFTDCFDFRRRVWGTSSDVSVPSVQWNTIGDDEATLKFDTAWSAPVGIYDLMATNKNIADVEIEVFALEEHSASALRGKIADGKFVYTNYPTKESIPRSFLSEWISLT